MNKYHQLEGTISIGVIATRVYPDIGGPAKYVFDLSKAFCRFGVVPTIITCRTRNQPLQSIVEDFEIIRLPVYTVPRKGLLMRLLFTIAFILLSTLMTIFYFGRRRTKLIHAHSPGVTGLVGLIAARIIGIRLVYTVHGLGRWSSENLKSRKNSVKDITEEVIASRADIVIAVSPDYYKHLERIKSGKKLYCIGSGVDTEIYKPCENSSFSVETRKALGLPSNKLLIVYVGNFYLPEKITGLVDLLTAFSRIDKHTRENGHLVIVGDGPARRMLENKAKMLGIESSVSFLGYRGNVPEILRASDVFVLPSRHEGSPLSLLEALSSGLACIGTRVGAIPDMIGEAGILVGPGKIHELVDSIQLLLTDSSLVKHLGIEARERAVNEFSWNEIAQRIVEIYRTYLEG